MKKILFALYGAALLLSACTAQDLYLEQNPYRKIVEYTPGTFSMNDIPGQVSVDMLYDWISYTQSGSTVNFTIRRNTGGIRRAEFSIAGCKDNLVISQRAHALDAKVSADIVSNVAGTATIAMSLSTGFADDYESWGITYGTSSDRSAGTEVPQTGFVVGDNTGKITGLKDGTDYFVWTYAVSTEGDKVYSDMVAIIPPVYVKAGEDLQAALNGAKAYAEVRVQGGAEFNGPIVFFGNQNKSISGGWNADFTSQSMDNLTVINGNGKTRGIVCTADETAAALPGTATVSYFEVKNCAGSGGVALVASGGPVNVHHCWFRDNTCTDGGVVATRSGGVATELNVWNCKFTQNTATSGHCCGVAFGEGPAVDNPVRGLVVNCLFVDNWCRAFGGYASVIFSQANARVAFVNNTIVENFNYMDGGTMYQGIVLRDNSANLFANNIIVGNTIAVDKQNPPVPFRHPNIIGAGSSGTTIVYNVYEGTWRGGSNVVAEGNVMCDVDFDYKTVCDANYQPCGQSLGLGSLSTFTVQDRRETEKHEFNLKSILGKYNTDFAGNPRVVNGKVDAGCYQVSK